MKNKIYARLDNTKVGDKVCVFMLGKYREFEVVKITSRTLKVKGTFISEEVFYYQSSVCGGYFRNFVHNPVYKVN